MPEYHKSVLVDEVLAGLGLKRNAPLKQVGKYLDATLGHGGHTIEMARSGALVLGIEADPEMLEMAQKRLQKEGLSDRVITVQANFRRLSQIAKEFGFDRVRGIFFDLGVASYHFLNSQRGFSFSDPEVQLDMRLNSSEGISASELLTALRPDQLIELFGKVLNRGEAIRLSRQIVQQRRVKPISTVGDFLTLVGKAGLGKKSQLHPATKAFLALRLAVNSELENLVTALPQAFHLLEKEGRLAVISFHSAEDRLVKRYFRLLEDEKRAKAVFRKPIRPSESEIAVNPLSRSAKLRIIEKI